jgi:hypothetical protein
MTSDNTDPTWRKPGQPPLAPPIPARTDSGIRDLLDAEHAPRHVVELFVADNALTTAGHTRIHGQTRVRGRRRLGARQRSNRPRLHRHHRRRGRRVWVQMEATPREAGCSKRCPSSGSMPRRPPCVLSRADAERRPGHTQSRHVTKRRCSASDCPLAPGRSTTTTTSVAAHSPTRTRCRSHATGSDQAGRR